MLIVDTSVLISFLKGHDTLACDYFLKLEATNTPYAIPSICVQEVLQGARDEKSWKLLRDYLLSQLIIVPTIKTHALAARIYYELRKKGLTVRSSNDCLIAQIAIENKAMLLHQDKDFVSISKIRSLKFPKF